MSIDAPVLGKGTRTVLCEIDDFENVGPLKIHVYTVPLEPGKNGEEVCEPFWLDGVGSFPITLMRNHELPISIRAFRYPIAINRHISRETHAIVEPGDKSTWPTVALLAGSEMCARRKTCIHEAKGQEKCRPAIAMGAGEIEDNKEPWVLRVDGRPVRKSELAQARKLEKAADKETNERLEANRNAGRGFKPVSISTSPVIKNPANEVVPAASSS